MPTLHRCTHENAEEFPDPQIISKGLWFPISLIFDALGFLPVTFT
jgi:hypothetical protein